MVDGTQTLRTELELARASQLTLLRLQLALHKSNRRVAMQALDDLLDIDAEMEGLAATLSGVPAHPASRATLSDFIGLQRAAITAEKHALAGGDLRADANPVDAPAPVEEVAAADLPEQPLVSEEEDLPAQLLLPEDEAGSEDPIGGRRWMHILAAAIVVVALGCGLIAWLWPEFSVTGVRVSG